MSVRNREVPKTGSTELHPDYVLVFDGPTKAVASHVSKALVVLSDSGFYVSVRPGGGDSMLILVRLEARLIASADQRTQIVLDSLPWGKLAGLTDSFPIGNELPTFLTSEPSLLGNSKAVESIAKYDWKTAAVFQLRWLMAVNLGGIALLGIVNWLTGNDFSLVYNLATLFSGTLTVAKWKSLLGTVSTASVAEEPVRPEYKGTDKETRELRRLLFIPLAALLLTVFTLGQFAVLVIEIFLTQFYDGPLLAIAKLVPAGAGVVAAIIFGLINTKVVDAYTEWEDYPTLSQLRAVKQQRSFYLDLLLAFLPVLLTAYIYLPFGNLLIGVLPYFRSSKFGQYVPLVSAFHLDTGRLVSQASFYMLQQPIIAMGTTIALPEALMYAKRSIFGQISAKNNNVFAREQMQPPFDADAELKLLVFAFGYVLVLSSVWPIGSVLLLLVTIVRGRVLLYSLSRRLRRPQPDATREATMGSLQQWCANLKFVLVAASIVAPTITVMYGSTNPAKTHSLNGDYLYDYAISAMQVPWVIILATALLSENAVLIVFTVASKFFTANESKKLGVQDDAAVSEKATAAVAEDGVWKQIDVAKELEALVGSKIQ